MVDVVCDFSACRLSCHSAHRGKSLILRPSAAGHPGHRLRLLSCRSAVVYPPPPCLTAKHANSCDRLRNAVIAIMAGSAALTWARTDHRHGASRVSDVRSACRTLVNRLHPGAAPNHHSTVGQPARTWPERGHSTRRAADHPASLSAQWQRRGPPAGSWTRCHQNSNWCRPASQNRARHS
jgi:hypothetical protein